MCVCVCVCVCSCCCSVASGDELENVIAGVRNEVKSAGMQDTRENCWSFFIDRVRRQLKVRTYVYT